MASSTFHADLRQRLLRDIAELQTEPYPNIALHVQDGDMTKACLIVTVDGYGPIHMTVEIPRSYPLSPPRVRVDSQIKHPNIFRGYICASILNTEEGYTPAYTLKGVAIQLLSFFGSDRIEQTGGGYHKYLSAYRTMHTSLPSQSYVCHKCQHGMQSGALSNSSATPATPPPSNVDSASLQLPILDANFPNVMEIAKLPNEILLLICNRLDTKELMLFAEAWSRIRHVMTEFDVIQTRELQCFCFKKDYMETKLGVGVSVERKSFNSEFDFLSQDAFKSHGIRRSVFGVQFRHWLPLPISHSHWRRIKDDIAVSLAGLTTAAELNRVKPVEVIYHFMNDVVVKLNKETPEPTTRVASYTYTETAKSSLTHASEKAIESYFHLFHLLLCMAADDSSIVDSASETLSNFANGMTSKADCPNLGHLLVAILISDVEITIDLIKTIIREAVTRNVVWMFHSKAGNMPELSYLEPSAVSEYRLKKTFEAGKTSYRLLMFLNLFRKTAVGSPPKPLLKLRDEAFERHGAPPRGSAKELSASIKRIHQIDNFLDFFDSMGIEKVSPASLTTFLRKCVQESEEKGYSSMPINQDRALTLRQRVEPNVEIAIGVIAVPVAMTTRFNFFPQRSDQGGQGGGGNQIGGEGTARGRSQNNRGGQGQVGTNSGRGQGGGNPGNPRGGGNRGGRGNRGGAGRGQGA